MSPRGTYNLHRTIKRINKKLKATSANCHACKHTHTHTPVPTFTYTLIHIHTHTNTHTLNTHSLNTHSLTPGNCKWFTYFQHIICSHNIDKDSN